MSYETEISLKAERERQRLDSLQRKKFMEAVGGLRRDPTWGDQIPKERIPKELINEFEVTNLWRFELPGAWSALYTIASRRGERPKVKILRVLTHKEYDRLFGYSTS